MLNAAYSMTSQNRNQEKQTKYNILTFHHMDMVVWVASPGNLVEGMVETLYTSAIKKQTFSY